MKVVFWLITGAKDPTRASVPLHVAANGTLEVGDEPIVMLAGDGTEYLAGTSLEQAEGVGVPPLRELFAKLREHEGPRLRLTSLRRRPWGVRGRSEQGRRHLHNATGSSPFAHRRGSSRHDLDNRSSARSNH